MTAKCGPIKLCAIKATFTTSHDPPQVTPRFQDSVVAMQAMSDGIGCGNSGALPLCVLK